MISDPVSLNYGRRQLLKVFWNFTAAKLLVDVICVSLERITCLCSTSKLQTVFRGENKKCELVLDTIMTVAMSSKLISSCDRTIICLSFLLLYALFFVLCAVVCLLILLCVHLTDLAFWLFFSFCAFSWIPWKQNLVSAVWSSPSLINYTV